MPDAKAVWLYREALARAGKVDASIVPAPDNHNKRDENAAIEAGEVPQGWENKPASGRRRMLMPVEQKAW